MAQIDDLPPLRDVIRRHGSVRQEIARPEFSARSQSDGAHRARRPAARGRDRGRGRSRAGRADAGAARARRRPRHRHRARRARDRRARRKSPRAIRAGSTSLPATRCASMRAHISAASRARIVANLPYNIATALLIDWLTTEPWPPWYDALVLMFQREVAERIVAAAGQQDLWPPVGAGGLALRDKDPVRRRTIRLRAAAQGDVVGRAARPARRAARLRRRRRLQRVTEAAFGQRRKMLRQSLKTLGVDALRAAGRSRHRADRARRGNSGRGLRRAGARLRQD